MKKRVKRLLSILLVCSVLASVCGLGMASASEDFVIVRADSVHVQAGERFEVPIQMIGGQGIMGFSVSFSYDETAMKPISVSPADDIGGGWEDSIETSKNNSFSVVWYGTENMTAQGTVFTLTFEALANASGDFSISLSYDQASTFDEAWEDVVLRTDAVSVHIDNENPSPRFLISDASVEAGDVYLCDVAVQNNTGFGIVSFTLFFDAAAMTPTEVRNGKGTVLSSNPSGSSGMVQVILDTLSADKADGVLFTVVFQTAANRTGSFPVTMTNSANYACKTGALTLTKNVQTGVPSVGVRQDMTIVNDIVTVPVHISNNTGIMGLRLRLTLDGAKFNVTSCARGDALNSGLFDYKYADDTGVVDVLWSSSEASYINDVCCVLTVQIKDKSADLLEIAIEYEQEDTFDENMENVALACEKAEIPLYRLVIHADSLSVNVGETLRLSATMLYVESQPQTITWTSGDPNVADIDETGLVRGLSRGIAIITADDGNGHTATVSIQILPIQPELQLFSLDGSYERKIDWWKRYSTATMMVSYIAYKCENAVNYEWSSSSKRVHIDQKGNITNTGCFARSADITLTAYDADGNVVASSTVTVRFYKFDWQFSRLQSQEVVSDNVFRPTASPDAVESETLVSFITAFLSKVFGVIIK